MLHVILLILKIILWIILAIIGLLVVLLLLVLFAPIRYKADVSYRGGKTMQAIVKVRYLIVSFGLQFSQETGAMEQTIRIFGFRLGKGKEKSKTEKSKTEETKTEESKPDIEEPDRKTEEPDRKTEESDRKNEEPKKIITEGIAEKTEKEQSDEALPETFDLESDIGDEIPESEKKARGRLKTFFVGIWNKLKRIWRFAEEHTPDKIAETIQSKVEPVKKKVRKIQKFWNLSCTVKTRDYLKRYIPSVFRHILPRRIKGYVHYGFDEPYKTGQITGYLSLMPFLYQKQLSLQPDFYQKVLDLHLILNGKIRIGYLARIALNINLWRTLKVAKKIMNSK